jgi:hypothetical protein
MIRFTYLSLTFLHHWANGAGSHLHGKISFMTNASLLDISLLDSGKY